MVKFLQRNALYFAWAIAFASLAGSLFFSNFLGFAPCVLCWYQRICMYPLVIILAAGIIRRSRDLEYYVIPLAGIGGLIGLYHVLLQAGIISEKLSPCTAGISCLTKYDVWFGFVTIPLLSTAAFLLIIMAMLFYRKGRV